VKRFIVPCQATTDASCLSFCPPASLRLTDRQNYFAILRHFLLGRTLERIIILSGILTVFALLSGCAAGLGLTKAETLTVYTHESPAFTVEYPEYWVKKEPKRSEVLSVSPTPARKSLPKMSVLVLNLPKGFNISNLPKLTVRRLKSAMPWATKFNKKSKDIQLNDGSSALRTAYTFGHNSMPLSFYVIQVSAIKDNTLVSLFAIDAKCLGSTKNLERYVDSFQFIEIETAETSSRTEKDVIEAAEQSVSKPEDDLAKSMDEPELDFGLPISKFTADDLAKIRQDVIIRNKPPALPPTPEGKVNVKGILMKKREIQLCEIIEDVEALEKYEPDYVSDLPDTGFVVQNDTDRKLTMEITGSIDKTLTVSAGESSAVALPEGTYKCSFSSDKDWSLKSFSGEKTIFKKCRYLFKFYLKD